MISYIYMGLIVLFVVALLVVGYVMDKDDHRDD
jgi:hypothetical protein